MADCLFCGIVSGKIPGDMVYQDAEVAAFRDVNPQAPVHILVVPVQHIATVNDVEAEHHALLGKMVSVAKSLAQQEGIAEDGYRLVLNCNAAGGQSVFHIHLHLLGGRQMQWPPG